MCDYTGLYKAFFKILQGDRRRLTYFLHSLTLFFPIFFTIFFITFYEINETINKILLLI